MKSKLVLSALAIIGLSASAFCQTPGKMQSGQVLLPNGWKLSPAGTSLQLGDLPLNIQLSSSGKLLAVTNYGGGARGGRGGGPGRGRRRGRGAGGRPGY